MQERGSSGLSSLDPNTSLVCCKSLFVTLPHDAPEGGSGFLQELNPCSLFFLVSSQPFDLCRKGPGVRVHSGI